MHKRQQGFTVMELLICIVGVCAVAGLIALVVVATHFIAKFW